MTKVRIRNFQSIGDIDLEIEGFTVIVGKSDIGKSAVIRSIDAALSNQAGDAFIRYGQANTTVNIDYKGTSIEWKKGDTSAYKVNGESFTKLNRAVPKPLLDAGFRKLEVGDQKINPLVASQFEPLFLLDKPGSIVTEVLSTLYKLNILSSADDKCQKELKSSKSILKTRDIDLNGLQEKLKSYKDFDSIKDSIKLLSDIEKKSIELKKTISEIEIYEKMLQESSIKLKKLFEISSVSIPDSKKVADFMETILWISEKTDTLINLASSVKKLKNSSVINIPTYEKTDSIDIELKQVILWDRTVKEYTSNVNKLKNIPSSNDVALLLEFYKNIEKMSESVSIVLELEKEFTSVAISARSARDELRKIEVELLCAQEDEKKERELLGGLCPICGKSL